MRKLTRKDKTTLLYVLICVGTAAAAFLCVLVSSLLLKAEERRLYDRPAYEPFTLETGRPTPPCSPPGTSFLRT